MNEAELAVLRNECSELRRTKAGAGAGSATASRVATVVARLKPQLEALALQEPKAALAAVLDLSFWMLEVMPDFSQFDFWNFPLESFAPVFGLWQGVAVRIGASEQFADSFAQLGSIVRKLFVLPELDQIPLELSAYTKWSHPEQWASGFRGVRPGNVARHVWTTLFHLRHRGTGGEMQDIISGTVPASLTPARMPVLESGQCAPDHAFGAHFQLMGIQKKYVAMMRVCRVLERWSWSIGVLHTMLTNRDMDIEAVLEGIAVFAERGVSTYFDGLKFVPTEELLLECFNMRKGPASTAPRNTKSLVESAAKLIGKQLALLPASEQAEWLRPIGQPALGFVCHQILVHRCVHHRQRHIIELYRGLLKRGDEEAAADLAVGILGLDVNWSFNYVAAAELIDLAKRFGRTAAMGELVPTSLTSGQLLVEALSRAGLRDAAASVGRSVCSLLTDAPPPNRRRPWNEETRTVVKFLATYLDLVATRQELLEVLPVLNTIPVHDLQSMLQRARADNHSRTIVYLLFAGEHPSDDCIGRYRDACEHLEIVTSSESTRDFVKYLQAQFPGNPVVAAMVMLARPRDQLRVTDLEALQDTIRRVSSDQYAQLHGLLCVVSLNADKAAGLRSVLQTISEKSEQQIKAVSSSVIPEQLGRLIEDMKKLQLWAAERTAFLREVSANLVHCTRCGWSYAVRCSSSNKRRNGKHQPFDSSRPTSSFSWKDFYGTEYG